MLQTLTDKQVLQFLMKCLEHLAILAANKLKKEKKKTPKKSCRDSITQQETGRLPFLMLYFSSHFFSIVPLFLHSQLIGKTRKAEERCQGRREELQPRPDGVNQCLGLLTRAC